MNLQNARCNNKDNQWLRFSLSCDVGQRWSVVIYWSSWRSYRSHLQRSSRWNQQGVRPYISAATYGTTLPNIPEERRCQLHLGWNPKYRKLYLYTCVWFININEEEFHIVRDDELRSGSLEIFYFPPMNGLHLI